MRTTGLKDTSSIFSLPSTTLTFLSSVLDWRVDGVPLAWQTEGPTLTRVKGRAGVCVCACVRETFSNVEAWPPMHILGHPLSHNVCLITTGAKATFVQAVLL